MTIGIISAMPEEVQTLVEALEDVSITNKGMRSYYAGTFPVSSISGGVFLDGAKVAAAATTTQLINDYAIDEIIFTGVAGALDSNLKVGDVVIGSKLFST